jgi:hypothetical protein
MSTQDGDSVAVRYAQLNNTAKNMGSTLRTPVYDFIIYGVTSDS